MGFSRQEYWSEFLFPSPGNLPDPGIEPGSPALQTDSLLSEPASCINHVSINPRSVGAKYATGEEWRNNSRKNEEVEPKQKQHRVVDVTGGGSKVQCCKEQNCVGTWNVRSMNQSKLEVVKQEMARMNINILGISEPKWTRMGIFNSDDHYIYYCGQESLRRNGVALIVNTSLKCSTWVQSQKWQNDLCLFPRQTIQYHSNPSLCPTSNAEEAEVEQFYEDLQDLLELTPKKRCPFHYWGLECKSRKSSDNWSNRQIWPRSTKWSRAKANRVLPRERTGHSKHPLPTRQEKTLYMDITRWSIPKSDWLYSLQPKKENLYTVSKNKTGSWLWLRSWTPYC